MTWAFMLLRCASPSFAAVEELQSAARGPLCATLKWSKSLLIAASSPPDLPSRAARLDLWGARCQTVSSRFNISAFDTAQLMRLYVYRLVIPGGGGFKWSVHHMR
jgi:hypothetical protein